MNNPIKMDDLGGNTPIFGNTHFGVKEIYDPLSKLFRLLQELAIELDDEREFTDKWARDCPKNYQA